MQPQESKRHSEPQSLKAELANPLVLLLVGLLPPSMARSKTLPETNELATILVSRWQKLQGRAWSWRLRKGVSRLIRTQEDADRLIQAGSELLAQAEDDWLRDGRGLRLEMNIPEEFDPSDLYHSLEASGIHSAFLRSKNEGEVNWSWPLRVGLASNSQLTVAIGPNSSLRPLFDAFNYEHPSIRANLLLCEGSLVEVIATLLTIQPRPHADALIIFGGVSGTNTPVGHSLSLISEVTEAQGIFIFEGLDHQRAQNFTEGLLAYLAHDLPVDSAVARLAREGSVSVISFATRRLVEATSVREQGHILARRLQQMPDVRIPLASQPAFSGRRSLPEAALERLRDSIPALGIKVRSAGSKNIAAKELGQALERSLRVPHVSTGAPSEATRLSFDRESHGATKLAELTNAVLMATDAEAARRENRYLQARVETPGGRAIKDQAKMLPERDYVASVFIGASDPSWLGIPQKIDLPEPPEGRPLLLDVLFWEPLACPEPQLAQLIVPNQGDSGIAQFPFRLAANQNHLLRADRRLSQESKSANRPVAWSHRR